MKTTHSKSKILFLFLFISLISSLRSQIKMGDHPLSLDPYAIFEIESKDKGVLFPRMTTQERDHAFSGFVPNSLLIFNSDKGVFEYYLQEYNQWRSVITQVPHLSLQNHLLSFGDQDHLDLIPYLDNTDQQKLSLKETILTLENGGSVDLSSLIPTLQDRQQLNLVSTTLSLERGGQVDLSPLIPIVHDRQQLNLVSTTLSLERGGQVDLSPLIPIVHDRQQLNLVSTTLSLERGGQVDLSPLIPIVHDRQQLNLVSTTLSLERGGQVDLSPLIPIVHDRQQLNLVSTTLSLERGGQVDLSPLIPIVHDRQQLNLVSTTLSLERGGQVDLSPLIPIVHDRQQLNLVSTTLSLERGGQVDLSPLIPIVHDRQQLNLVSTTLSLERGGQVDLSPLIPIVHDRQQLNLVSTTLSLERGGQVDLSPLIPIVHDRQQLNLVSTTLSLERGGQVDLSPLIPIVHDRQQLNLVSTTLSLERGGQVDLSPLIPIVHDRQQLSISLIDSKTLLLSISNGNSIELKSKGNLVFSSVSSQSISLMALKSVFTNKNGISSNETQNWDKDHFVFGSPQLDNDTKTDSDNRRMFFDKRKGAFRAGFAQSDQWDKTKRGTYSVAMGRNTIASGFNSLAFGLSTVSDAWYTTTMGIGTHAVSRAETIIGSYNTIYTSLGGTRDWNPSDRLFVIGNGQSSSTASRSDALVLYKNGNTFVSGIWTGPGFQVVSDRKLKTKIQPLKQGLNSIKKLMPRQYEFKKRKGRVRYGFMADELEKIMPSLVVKSKQTGLKSVDYNGLIPVLVQAIQEQQKEIENLKKELHRYQF